VKLKPHCELSHQNTTADTHCRNMKEKMMGGKIHRNLSFLKKT